MSKGICVAGNMLVDILYPTSGWPKQGELVHIQDGISRSIGGAVCNVIVDLAKLDPSLPLYAMGKTGTDAEGDLILERLGEHANIDTSCVVRDGISAFTAVMSDQISKERTFFTYLGANGKFDERDVDWAKVDADIFHIGYILLLNALDQPDDEYGTKLARLLHQARQHGMKTSIDVVSEASDRFMRLVPPALKYTDYCIINEVEAQQTTGVKLRGEGDRLLTENMPEALKAMKRMGVTTWAVIHCPEGGFGLDENDQYVALDSLHLPKGYIKGSVGAGDAFCAGVLYGAEKRYSLSDSIALGIASGVSPEQGLYTAIVAGFLIAFLGGSRVQISGPTAAFATIVAGIVATDGMEGLIAATIIAGILLVLMGLFKLGAIIRFVPFTITTGFTAGIAVTLTIGQLKDFFGLTYPPDTVTVETTEKLAALVGNFSTVNWQACLVGVVCLAILFLWPRVTERVPSSLVALLAGIALVSGLGLEVSTIGDLYVIDSALPAFRMPELTLELFRDQFANGVTIAILAAIESLLSCVVADSMISGHHRANMELVAQGVGNIASVLFGGIPATGAIARTAANVKAGGRTPISGMVHALVLVAVLAFLMPYAALIPMPTIAAILLYVAYGMSGWRNFAHLCRTASKGAVATLVLTFVLTIVFDLVVAIGVGMLITVVLFMKMVSEETEVKGWKYYCDENSEVTHLRELPKSVRVYEINGPMFFGMTERIADISVKDFTRYLIIRMRGVPSLDATGMNALENLYDYCNSHGVRLIFSHVNEQPMKTMRRAGFVDLVGEEHFRSCIDDAIAHARELLEAEQDVRRASREARRS